MKKLLTTAMSLLLFTTSASCLAQGSATPTDIKVSCLGVELDGSQTLRVEGVGKGRKDAKEQAKKNAVWATLFTGVREGVTGCNLRPLVTEVNARERYEDYFNAFFKDNGPYKEFVTSQDTKRHSSSKEKDKIGATYQITVRVLRAELKEKLKTDHIIK